MSKAAKESASRWLGQLWGAYVDDVATNRQVSKQTLNPSMKEFLAQLEEQDGDLAGLSLELGLVDELATRQQVRADLVEVFGSNGEDSYQHVDYYQYMTTLKPEWKLRFSR